MHCGLTWYGACIDMAEPITVISTVAGVISAAMALSERMRGRNDSNDEVLLAIRALSQQLEAARIEIVRAIADLEDRDLEGATLGYLLALQEYDGRKKDEDYLNKVVLDGLETFGRLAVLIEDLDPMTDRHIRVLDILLALVFLRSIAMYERERRFKRDDIKDIPLMYPYAVAELLRALAALRVRSDRRITGPYTQRQADMIMIGYYVDNGFVYVTDAIDEPIEKGIHQSLGPGLAETREAMARRRDEIFEAEPRRSYWERIVENFTSGTETNRVPKSAR